MVPGNSLVVQWLGLCTLTAEDLGSIPGGGTKKKKKKIPENLRSTDIP